MSYGLLLLRVVVGATMFGRERRSSLAGSEALVRKEPAAFSDSSVFRAPLALAIVAGLSEASGALLAVGFVTPLAALAIAVVMFNAIWTVHWSKGFWNSNGGLEFPLTLATVAIALAATGPGGSRSTG